MAIGGPSVRTFQMVCGAGCFCLVRGEEEGHLTRNRLSRIKLNITAQHSRLRFKYHNALVTCGIDTAQKKSGT